MRSLILMIQFLTRIPIPIPIDMDKKTVSRGVIFFPLIGMLVGSISFGAYYLLSFINKDVASLGAVIASVAATGGLHIDGLSDTCDGFFSARSRERILEIMKDSRVGTFGVIAIVFNLLAKYVLIKNLKMSIVFPALIFVYGASRLGAAMLITFGRTARAGGLGDLFSSGACKSYFFISALLFIAAGVFYAGWQFLIFIASILVLCIILMLKSYKTIGGLTGDVYGAAIELSEIAGLAAFCLYKFI